MEIVNAFVTAITLLVVAIPEGLPLAVTLSLAFAVGKMLEDQNLVRQLHACETMGGANIICSDKTGTLTKNEMEATNLWNETDRIIYSDKTGDVFAFQTFVHPDQQETFLNAIIHNSTEDPGKKSGNPTEMAILKYLQKCEVDVLSYRQKAEKIFEASFSSDRKRMSSVIRLPNGKVYVFLKGASEFTLEICQDLLVLESNQTVQLD